MADILIRGMEMPKCCNDCRFAWIDTDHFDIDKVLQYPFAPWEEITYDRTNETD